MVFMEEIQNSNPVETKENVKEAKEAKKVHKKMKKEKKENKNGFLSDAGVWKFVGITVAVLLVVSIFTNGFRFGGGGVTVKGALGKEQAAEKAIDYVNNNLLQPGLSATLVDVEDLGDLYRLKVSLSGQTFDSYITKDARLLFATGYDISESAGSGAGSSGDSGAQPSGSNVRRVDVSADDDPVMGSASAAVTIIEFSDFQCPFCRKFWKETLPQIVEEYVDTGKVKFVYRDFPLSFHPGAEPAARAAECADEQGKFWEMHDKIFEEEDKQGQGTIQFDEEDLKTWAKGVSGLKYADWEKCFDSGKYADEVANDFSDGTAAGVSGTPSFFINGRQVEGAVPFAEIKAVIEEELKADSGSEDSRNSGSGAAVADVEASEEVDVDITAKKYRFEPNEVKVKKGSAVKLSVKSIDADFGFSLDEYGVFIDLNPGETGSLRFTADEAGEFTFSCSDCDGKETVMKGKLIVE